MTKAEAIALLRNLEDSLDSYCGLNEKGKTVFRMAIEALSQESSEDVINRQAAIEYIKECAQAAHSNYECDMEQGYINAIECLEELPSAQPELRRGEES